MVSNERLDGVVKPLFKLPPKANGRESWDVERLAKRIDSPSMYILIIPSPPSPTYARRQYVGCYGPCLQQDCDPGPQVVSTAMDPKLLFWISA